MSCPTDECNQCGAQRWAWKDNQLPKCSLDDCDSRPGGTPCCFKADDLCARLLADANWTRAMLTDDGMESLRKDLRGAAARIKELEVLLKEKDKYISAMLHEGGY